MSETQRFDASKYLTKVSGQDYLEVKWRLLWLRTEHPDAIIESELVKLDTTIGRVFNKNTQAYEEQETERAIFRATISIPGRGSATSYGSETRTDFEDFIEKAETKAFGRALAALGFGTQFCDDMAMVNPDGSPHVVDAPVRRPGTPAPICESCGGEVRPIAPRNGKPGWTAEEYAHWTKQSYGKVYCQKCRPRSKRGAAS